jgi:hypothetical protein
LLLCGSGFPCHQRLRLSSTSIHSQWPQITKSRLQDRTEYRRHPVIYQRPHGRSFQPSCKSCMSTCVFPSISRPIPSLLRPFQGWSTTQTMKS